MTKVQFISYTVNFIIIFGNLVTYAIIGRVLVSWFTMGSPGPKGRFSQVLYDITEPIMRLVQKIPHRIGMIDLSPLIALIGIDLLVRFIVNLLYNI